MSSRRPPPAAADRAAEAGDAALARDIVTLHKALSLDPSRRRRSLPLPLPPPSATSLTAISHLGRRRLDCAFTLHVHSIDNLPTALDGSPLTVHFRRLSASASTRPVPPALGAAAFDEPLTQRSPVYFSRGAKNAVKYEPRAFAVAVNAAALELGRHEVDLTRLLPLSIDDLDDGGDSGFGKWTTSFRLSGVARGARLNVTFACALVPAAGEQQVAGLRRGSVARQAPTPVPARTRDVVRVLHEVLPSTRPAKALAFAGDAGLGATKAAVEPEEDGSPESKHCTSVEVKKGEGDFAHPDGDCYSAEFNVVEQGVEVAIQDLEQLKPAEPDYVAHPAENFNGEANEEGTTKPAFFGDDPAKDDDTVEVKLEEEPSDVAPETDDVGDKQAAPVQAAVLPTSALEEDGQLAEDAELEDLESLFNKFAIVEPDEFDSPTVDDKLSRRMSCMGAVDGYNSASRKSRSRSVDASSDFVASEFLEMLGIEHSPFGPTTDSDSESPREKLWKQFEKEALESGDCILGLDFEDGAEEASCDDFAEEFDLSAIIHEAELELQNAAPPIDATFTAKSLEDQEAEALMRQFGINEKSFQSSPRGTRSGFGSPIDIPPELPLELPPLADGLGPFIQTEDGGFLRSMNPALFKNAKNNCSLVMQASSPIVLPAEMGSGIMEILHGLASVGIEKLSMQANKLMPLEDVNGKMMQQLAWGACPALESAGRYDLLENHSMEALAGGVSDAPSGKKKKRRGADLSSSLGGINASEYVSLEDLAPLAMEKIEALSIEGLRIQSGMSEEEAPSNISAHPVGEISSLQGKCAENTRTLGLEGTAGLQLLDVKQSGGDVDGLMGLSITLDEWMRLDSGVVDEEEQFSDRTSKILAAHHAKSMDLLAENQNADKKSRRSGRRWGLLGNNFTVALMVQLRDPLRNYEPVGTPMLSLIQVERVFIPPKPKIYTAVSEKGNSEEYYEEPKTEEILDKALVAEEKIEEEDSVPQFKVTEVHVAGFKSEPEKTKPWGNQTQQQAGSRWLLGAGMGKGNKNPLMKSKAIAKPTKDAAGQQGDTLWSISSRVHGPETRWGELTGSKRNPNILLQKDKRFR
ncbi:protein PLASTID MOVEMENT IMPAIRED 1-RELATED 1-like [Lolium rigidum]|uniref:protein PLASTID MOVEMENT IMPAIRED 1-RELATED 1-like n=1 Tax=Lolium rigidum TaxID=89674 RepID=UPI001F5C9A4B|nr:protein PLASTID MOVEMENT IMPAIRED 1-RELATED 1-like [Lolium rigidum]